AEALKRKRATRRSQGQRAALRGRIGDRGATRRDVMEPRRRRSPRGGYVRTPENTGGEDERSLDDRRMPPSGAAAPSPDDAVPDAHALHGPTPGTADSDGAPGSGGAPRRYARPHLSRREIEVLR